MSVEDLDQRIMDYEREKLDLSRLYDETLNQVWADPNYKRLKQEEELRLKDYESALELTKTYFERLKEKVYTAKKIEYYTNRLKILEQKSE